MAVELEIREGDPWWLSPDVWVVPGSDPEGSPGQPIAGTSAYLWAKVRNRGSSIANNAEVRFYWADPSAGFNRETANLVGVSFVSLDPGDVGEVLCLQPWIPEFVNDGHECILAETFHNPNDPLPPNLEFNVPTDRHVAQRNLDILQADLTGFFRFNFNLFNTFRTEQRFTISLQYGKERDLEPMLPTLGEDFRIPDLTGELAAVAFVNDKCAGPESLGKKKKKKLHVTIAGHRKTNHTLVGRIGGGATLLHIVQHGEIRDVGGLSVLVLPTS